MLPGPSARYRTLSSLSAKTEILNPGGRRSASSLRGSPPWPAAGARPWQPSRTTANNARRYIDLPPVRIYPSQRGFTFGHQLTTGDCLFGRPLDDTGHSGFDVRELRRLHSLFFQEFLV